MLAQDLDSFATIYWCNQVLIWTRAAFLLIDPYLARRLLPNFASALLYGIYFPVLNLQSLALLQLMGLRGRAFDIFWYTTAGQFVTQVSGTCRRRRRCCCNACNGCAWLLEARAPCGAALALVH